MGTAFPQVQRRSAPLLAAVVVIAAWLCATATAAAAPPNDDINRAASVRVGSAVKGSVSGATRERGEPRHRGSLTARSVWYRFHARRRQAVKVGTCTSALNTLLAVYSGRSLRSLRTVESNNDGCGRRGGGSRVFFSARRGTTYWIAVAAFASSGRFRLELESVVAPPNDDFADASRLTLGVPFVGTTQDATRELGEPRRTGGPHTVWFRLAVLDPTDVRLDACTGTSPRVAVYTGRAVSRLTRVPVTSSGCSVQLAARVGVTYRIVLEGFDTRGEFSLTARAVTRPVNDDFADATDIAVGDEVTATTQYATREPGEPRHSYSYPRTVWFRLHVPSAGNVLLTACTEGYPMLTVYRGTKLRDLSRVTPAPGSCDVRFKARAGVYLVAAEDDSERIFSLRSGNLGPAG